MRTSRVTGLILGGVIVAAATFCATQASAAEPPETVYSAVPATLPGNLVSHAFTATQTSEFGDHVGLTGAARRLAGVDVVLSSWACESGAWTASCVTTPGATFEHEITVNVYAVDTTGTIPAPGALLASATELFDIPYRPTADPTCPSPTQWRSPTACFNGFATMVSFDGLEALAVDLPSEVIVSVAFETSVDGLMVGGPYDSLNVAVTTDLPSGSDVEPTVGFLDSALASEYDPTDGGTPGTFRRASTFDVQGVSYTPVVALRAITPQQAVVAPPVTAPAATTPPAAATPTANQLAVTGTDPAGIAVSTLVLLSGVALVVVARRGRAVRS
ncbi:hypothetical protein [Cellulomonas humilata]|uniref:Gram-positive cocci surface proteins LPxTG domain-containing protein n=1 Tax=Cellulomonas humilata TaxID=144055 RepID=A0ABU0EFY1_9CELL|nr:hypothetical protein [Cellulomonas humilata]MDQ0374189.1 hypothetical protein [Cellulomonas humilata]